MVAAAPSGSGLQFSLFGLLGASVSPVEGLEINVLGLSFGINPFDLSIKLPMLGRIGPGRVFGQRTPAAAPASRPQASPR